MQKIVVAAIINHKRKILIAKRNKKSNEGGFWEFPGGKVEYLEAPEKSLIREIKEELNIKVKPEELFAVQSGSYVKNNEKIHIIIIFYKCRYVSGKLKLNDHEDIKWVGPVEMRKYKFVKADKRIAKELLKK